MTKKITYKELPDILPIFPLPGVILLPKGNLPLNIFEPRYISMVEDALGNNRIIGMIQPNPGSKKDNGLYPIGCASKIISFSETSDNRYLIELKGIIRFRIFKEVDTIRGYRNIIPVWESFKQDLSINSEKLNIDGLLELLKKYFNNNNINVDSEELHKVPADQIISAIPQICSFQNSEKQAILEAKTDKERVDVIISLLKMNLLDESENTTTDTIN
tara:strand:- start:548 stop:1198 length:651 start_codon:yes stop_codon:yes gene_type:complete